MTNACIEELTKTWNSRGFRCEERIDAPGKADPLHAFDHDELLVVLEGDIEVDIAGKTLCPTAGESVVIPAGAEHEVRNVGSQPARCLHGFEHDLAQTD